MRKVILNPTKGDIIRAHVQNDKCSLLFNDDHSLCEISNSNRNYPNTSAARLSTSVTRCWITTVDSADFDPEWLF